MLDDYYSIVDENGNVIYPEMPWPAFIAAIAIFVTAWAAPFVVSFFG